MKTLAKLTIFTIILALPLIASAQKKTSWPKEVTIIESKGNETVSAEGDLANGSIMEDISWAWNSSNACFPGTQSLKFRGNHVFFATVTLPRSITYISVKPTDENADLSIYAYRIGAQEFRLVPDLPSSITCEADHKWDRPWKGKVQTSERKMEFQNPGGNSYNILIGVTAPKGVTTGKFKVEIRTQS